MKDLTLNFELRTSQIAEIVNADSWNGNGVLSLSTDEIQEMTSGDDKPMYVEFLALYEDMSGNKRIYSKDAVKSCVDAMVGVNMYKGHEEPGTNSWKYREPVGRIVAAKLEEIDIGGKKVLGAKGKAYITEADPKLRSDIKKKMAGAVSILGNAKMVSKLNDDVKTVVHLTKPLKSVDFCNPGTGGLSHAGVTAVVSEMVGTATETEIKETEEPKMTKKLTKPELLAEYPEEINALIGEQIETQVKAVANDRIALNTEKTKLEGQVSEMAAKVTATEAVANDWKAKYEAERDLRIAAELSVFANERVAEMKGAEGANAKIIDLAFKKVKPVVVGGDLEKSKTSFNAALKDAVEEVEQLAEMIGGNPEPKQVEKPTKEHKNNPAKKTTGGVERFLSPEVKAAREKRVGV